MNSTWMSTQNVYEINTTKLNKTYILLKIILSNRFSLDNTGYFYKFKIFKEFSKSIEPLNSAEETLITEFFVNNIILITSNISNLRTFENNQSSSFIYQRESSYFSFNILPTQEPYILEMHSLKKDTFGEIFINEKSFINYFSIIYFRKSKIRFNIKY